MTLEQRLILLAQAIGADIKTTQEGWPLGIPLVRKLDTQLWEVRSRIPEGIARIARTIRELRP